MATELNTKRIAKNTVLLYVRMFVTMVVSLFTSRIVLNTLGVEDYGIYNVVGSIVVMFSFISSPLSTALQRFLNVEMGRGDERQVRRVFSSGIVAYVVIVLLIIILSETVGLWALKGRLNVPEARLDMAYYVFHISLLTFCFSVLKSPFEAAILAHERMDAYAYFCIFDVLFKLLFVFLLAKTPVDKLLFYAIGYCVISLIITLIYAGYCRLKFKNIRFSLSFFDKSVFKSILTFSGWSTFGGVVYSGLTSGINLIINHFFGVVVNAAAGIKNAIVSSVYGFVSNFQVAFKPQLFQLYGANKKEEFLRLIFFSSKLSSYLYFLLIIPIYPIIPFILNLWLGQIPDYAVDFIRLGLLFNLIPACDGPLWMCVYATGKIKRYQLILNSIEICNIPLIILLCYLGMPPQGVFVTRIVTELIVFFVRWWYLVKYVDFPLKRYVREVFIPIIRVLFLLLIIVYFASHVDQTIAVSILIGCILIIISIVLICFGGLNKEERVRIIGFIRNKIGLRRAS